MSDYQKLKRIEAMLLKYLNDDDATADDVSDSLFLIMQLIESNINGGWK